MGFCAPSAFRRRRQSPYKSFGPFRAVVEATGTYRWFQRLVSPLGTVLLAHPGKLRIMVQRRTKTDNLDAQLLANLLRIDQIPLAYIPPDEYQLLRDITRQRARLVRGQGAVKNSLRALLARYNREPIFKYPFGPRGLCWFSKQDFSFVDNIVRDELIARFRHYTVEINGINQALEKLATMYPQIEALIELRGIATYTALVIIGELGDVTRFRRAKQVASYAGLTTRVNQSGEHCHHGHISKQGSPWLRWLLIEAGMKLVHQDIPLANFYQRIRKRSSAKIARVAVARKLAEICWKRLVAWEKQHRCQRAIA